MSSGTIELRGHKLNREDVRIIFNCSGSTTAQLSEQYEAHSDNDVSILQKNTFDNFFEEKKINEMFNFDRSF